MGLFIDLNKSMLNFAKLVKKPVQVKGKNGKTFTRMQWVSPEEASTGHGVRQIKTPEGLKRAMADGIDKHPQFHQAMEDQGVSKENFEEGHPHFFLPETEESERNNDNKLSHALDNNDMDSVKEEKKHHHNYPHGMKVTGHLFDKHHFVPKEEDTEEHKKEEAFLTKYKIHPEVSKAVNDISTVDLGDESMSDKLRIVNNRYSLHRDRINKHIENKIREDLQGDDKETKFIRNVQLTALKNGNMEHSMSVGQHPEVARAAVNKLLGGEARANEFRKHLKDASLSINFPGMHIKNIQKNGYKSSQLEEYVRKQGGDEAVEELEKAIADNDDYESQIDAIGDLPGGYFWEDVVQRANAEHNSIGLELEDRKPTYVALNPMNDIEGAATMYGNRWLKVNDDLLKYCTATADDSFYDTSAFPKIWSMDHLKDIFLLKQIDHWALDNDSDPTDAQGEWATETGDIPIELQLHKPSISPDQFEIMPDPDAVRRANAKVLNPEDFAKEINDRFGHIGTMKPTDEIDEFSPNASVWRDEHGNKALVFPMDADGSTYVSMKDSNGVSLNSGYLKGVSSDVFNNTTPSQKDYDDLDDLQHFSEEDIDKLLSDDEDNFNLDLDDDDLEDLDDLDLDDDLDDYLLDDDE